MEFTKVPKDIMITRNLFLRGLALIYLIANLITMIVMQLTSNGHTITRMVIVTHSIRLTI